MQVKKSVQVVMVFWRIGRSCSSFGTLFRSFIAVLTNIGDKLLFLTPLSYVKRAGIVV